MSFERVRLWHRIRELAAEDDSPEVRAMWAEVLAGVDGPGDLLRASETGEQGPA